MITTIKVVEGQNNTAYVELQGLSADTKPATSIENLTIKSGSMFYEIDTKAGFAYDANNVNPVTSNHWWEV